MSYTNVYCSFMVTEWLKFIFWSKVKADTSLDIKCFILSYEGSHLAIQIRFKTVEEASCEICLLYHPSQI